MNFSSEESGLLLQVRLPPLGQAVELHTAYAQQLPEVLVRQVILETKHRQRHSQAALCSRHTVITCLCVMLAMARSVIAEDAEGL